MRDIPWGIHWNTRTAVPGSMASKQGQGKEALASKLSLLCTWTLCVKCFGFCDSISNQKRDCINALDCEQATVCGLNNPSGRAKPLWDYLSQDSPMSGGRRFRGQFRNGAQTTNAHVGKARRGGNAGIWRRCGTRAEVHQSSDSVYAIAEGLAFSDRGCAIRDGVYSRRVSGADCVGVGTYGGTCEQSGRCQVCE